MLTRPALTALVLALAPSAGGCGLGCGAELAVTPVHIEGHGQSTVDLAMTATLTDNGDPVSGAKVEFVALGPDGVVLGAAATGPDGVARLDAPGALGPDSISGPKADSWTTYAARVALLQSTSEAADAVCAEDATAPFEFTP